MQVLSTEEVYRPELLQPGMASPLSQPVQIPSSYSFAATMCVPMTTPKADCLSNT